MNNKQDDWITFARLGLFDKLEPVEKKCNHCVSPPYCEFNGRCQKKLDQ